jgi:hypothetical protein
MQPQRCESSSSQIMTMAEVTGRVGQELATLAEATRDLQNLISPLILEAAGRNLAQLHELQYLDHVAQKLCNLGDFVTTLATHMPSHWLVDLSAASQVVTLTDLSSRLARNEVIDSAEGHPAGDFELF